MNNLARQGMPSGPIETTYKGCRFRSRLEARWAVFFDTVGIKWQYEPQGFQTEAGVRWLPDFFLPTTATWVEVKGSDDLLYEDWKRLAAMLDHDSPVPGIKNSYTTQCRGMVLLGEIPIPKFGLTIHPVIQHSDDRGLVRGWGTFLREWVDDVGPLGGLTYLSFGLLASFLDVPSEQINLGSDAEHWSVAHRHIETPCAARTILKGYEAARSARFEHGQHGAMRA